IPDDYISNEAERLLFYKKISAVLSEKELREITDEMRDRFGEMPESALNLLRVVELKLLMKNLLVEKLDIGDSQATATFLRNSPLYQQFAPSGRYRIFYEDGKGLDALRGSLEGLTKSRAMKQRIKQ
ncbi:MAG TPA: TRCF domain-containing protein, partial [Thermodesulfobacteriota bacterium]|nr:TRCF domain-containing protein [Thermodesulfobacteriota bacterium]